MDPRVTELHCIMPIANIPSVMQHGILSHERAEKLQHHSVAMQPVQDRRDSKRVPAGLKLHQYANLYFHARNPMMFVRKADAPNLCVLQISLDVLRVDGVVITDSNAASTYVRFLDPSQWSEIDFNDVFADDWTHADNPPRYYQHKSRKCAEVLAPHGVGPQLISGAYVVDATAEADLRASGFPLPITVNRVIFFR